VAHSLALKNIIVYRYIIINGWKFGQGMPVKQDHWNEIWKLTKEAWESLHAKVGIFDSPPAKPNLKITRTESQSIAGFHWKSSDDGALSSSLEVRLFLDCGYLQLGIWQHGEELVADFNKLQRQVEHIASQKDDLSDIRETLQIDEVFCWYAEVDSEESLPQLTRYFLEPYTKSEDQIDICNFSWGCVGIPRKQKTPLLILCHEDAPGVEDISWFVNYVAPRLALYPCKIICQYNRYDNEEKEREKIQKIVQQLSMMLRGQERGGNLNELEERIKEISSQVDKLIEELGHVKKRLIGMGDNLRQIRRVLQDPIFEGKSDVLWQIFGESSALLVEQVDVDFEYSESYNQEALLTLQTLQAFVQVEQAKLQRERAREERSMVKILGVIGLVLALIDGFSDVFHWGIKVLILLIGVAAGLWIWFWGKKKEKNEPENKKVTS
jgi:hypothetical protein